MKIWFDEHGIPYTGDGRPGDREATAREIAGLALRDGRQAKAAAIARALGQRIAEGIVWRGVAWQIDEVSQARITGRAFYARECLAGFSQWSAEYQGWIAADNSRPAFTAQEFIDFAKAAHAHFTALTVRARHLKDALLAATSIEEIDDIDVDARWPDMNHTAAGKR